MEEGVIDPFGEETVAPDGTVTVTVTGYVPMERLEVPLENNITLPVIHMIKSD